MVYSTASITNLHNEYPHLFLSSQAKSTENMADIPRLGHSDEFSYLFSFDPDGSLTDQKDYVTGLVFVGCFIFIFFLVWSIVLLIFKFCINGFLSGDPFTNPNLKDPSAQKLLNREIDEELEEEANEWRKRPIRVRLAFLLAGILQIIFAILMVTHGIANLQETTDTVEYSSNAARLLLDESVSVSQSLVQIGDTAKTLRDQIVMDLDRDNFCPQNPIFDETQAGKDILTAADASVQMLNDLGDFIEENVAGLEESLEDGKNNLDGVDDLIRSIEDYDWIGEYVTCYYNVVSLIGWVFSWLVGKHRVLIVFFCFVFLYFCIHMLIHNTTQHITTQVVSLHFPTLS